MHYILVHNKVDKSTIFPLSLQSPSSKTQQRKTWLKSWSSKLNTW